MTDMKVANEIYRQLGRGAMAMLGAKNPVGSETGLTFRIGRNAKHVSHVKIELASDDTYTITFGQVRKLQWKALSEHVGIYADSMHDLIERETGMYTNL